MKSKPTEQNTATSLPVSGCIEEKKVLEIDGKKFELLRRIDRQHFETPDGCFRIVPICFRHEPGDLNFEIATLPAEPPKKICSIQFPENCNKARLSDGKVVFHDHLLIKFALAKKVERAEEVGCLVLYPGGEELYSKKLIGPYDPPEDETKPTAEDRSEIMKQGKRFDLLNEYHCIRDKVGKCEYHVTDGTAAHRALKAFAEKTDASNRLPAAKIRELMPNSSGLENKPKRWFECGIKLGKVAPDFMEEIFPALIKNGSGLWWIDLNGK